jgi:hypothetical protein
MDQDNPDDTGEGDAKSGEHLETMLHPANLDPTNLLDKNLESDLLPNENELTQIDSKTLEDIFKDDGDLDTGPQHQRK